MLLQLRNVERLAAKFAAAHAVLVENDSSDDTGKVRATMVHHR
jgi:hypothetical protein